MYLSNKGDNTMNKTIETENYNYDKVISKIDNHLKHLDHNSWAYKTFTKKKQEEESLAILSVGGADVSGIIKVHNPIYHI